MANFETIKLDKGLYNTNKGFLNELESIDPSENYKGTSLEGLDAFERQLKRFDIKINGANSDSIEKFFATTDSATLFPEYVSRAVYQGLTEDNSIDKIIATKTNINGLDYRTVRLTSTDSDLSPQIVAEGAALPEAVISTKDNLVSLKKHGRMLVASYEAIRFQRIDLFTIALRKMGAAIARSQFLNAIEVLISGDGNDNAAPEFALTNEGTLTYEDMIKFWNSFAPYNMNTLIVSNNVMHKLLTMPEFRDANAGLTFHGSGAMITPLGANVINTTDVTDTIVGLDKNYALEMVTAGGIHTDYDKLIDRQLERAAISQISGFSKIFKEASSIISL